MDILLIKTHISLFKRSKVSKAFTSIQFKLLKHEHGDNHLCLVYHISTEKNIFLQVNTMAAHKLLDRHRGKYTRTTKSLNS